MARRSSHFPRVLLFDGLAVVFMFFSCCSAQSAQVCNTTTDCGLNAACPSTKYCTCAANYISPSGSSTDCRNTSVPDPRCLSFDPQCVFCGNFFKGPCLLCVPTYYLSNQKCVAACSSSGFSFQPVINTTVGAKTCLSGSNSDALPNWAVILIAVLSFAFVVLLGSIIVVIYYVWYRTSNARSFPIGRSAPAPAPLRPISPASRFAPQQADIPLVPTASGVRGLPPLDALEDVNVMTNPDDDEEAIFLEKLAHLRSQAVTFLDILNDIRRKMKKLPQQSATTTHYKNICQDLMRLLYLLNKKQPSVLMPPDGVQLLVWAEKILAKYPKISRKSLQPSRLSRIGEQDETHF